MMTEGAEKAGTSALGRAMVWGSWLVVLVLLAWLFDGVLDARRNPNREVQGSYDAHMREVRLRRNPYGHYVATGRINGQAVEFVVDTGATTVAVPGTLASALNLQRGAATRVMTANGTVRAYEARLDQVQLGDIVLTDVRANINPHMDDGVVLLGMSFLRNLELIQRNDFLIIRQPVSAP